MKKSVSEQLLFRVYSEELKVSLQYQCMKGFSGELMQLDQREVVTNSSTSNISLRRWSTVSWSTGEQLEGVKSNLENIRDDAYNENKGKLKKLCEKVSTLIKLDRNIDWNFILNIKIDKLVDNYQITIDFIFLKSSLRLHSTCNAKYFHVIRLKAKL